MSALRCLLLLLAAGVARGLAGFSQLELPCGDAAATRSRLVVNSHALYTQAVEHMFLSLLSIGFTDFCSVVVVVGGAHAELSPQRRGNVTYAETVLNAFDNHALDALGRYIDHPLVQADAYLYTIDTVLFHPSFRLFWAGLGDMFAGERRDDVFKPPLTHGVQGSLWAFGSQAPRRWAASAFYRRNLTKNEAVIAEQHSGEIGRWGVVRHSMERRVERKSGGGYVEVDVYNRGHPRRLFFYPDFGMYKWVLWLKSGDFEGEPHFNTFKKNLPDPYTGLISLEFNDGEVQDGETRVPGPEERRKAAKKKEGAGGKPKPS